MIDNLKLKNSTFVSLNAHNALELSGLQLKYFMRTSEKTFYYCLIGSTLRVQLLVKIGILASELYDLFVSKKLLEMLKSPE